VYIERYNEEAIVKEYSIEQIRNIALVGHGTSGKTSLAEAMLFSAGVTNRLGRVEEGTTQSDYSDDEIQRQISIAASMLHCEWKGTKFNIIDTPGYADFKGEAKSGLRAVDGAVVILHAVSGIEVGTDLVWRYASEYNTPCLIYVNQMDKDRVAFDRVCEMAKERFGKGALPFQIPVNPGEGFNCIIDLIRMKMLRYAQDESGNFQEEDIPSEFQDQAEDMRTALIEAAAESDDDLLEKYLDEGELSDEEFMAGLRASTIARELFPILCGDAARNIGAKSLMTAIAGYLPAPNESVPQAGKNPHSEEEIEVEASSDSALAALVFKTISEPHVGELSLVRVYSGVLRSGEDVQNATQGASERVGQIYFLVGRDRNEIGSVPAGDMAALVKLRITKTGDTLCSPNRPVVLPGIGFPEPVIRIAVEPKAKGDEERISTGLARLHEEDPAFVAAYDAEVRQTIVSGQGELHLEVIMGKLKGKFGVEVETVEPRIPYRETITTTAEAKHRYKKQSGGRGQYGDVSLRLAPLSRGEGFEFANEITGGVIPSKYIPAVEKGVIESMDEGVLAGYRVVDVRTAVFFGSYHTVDSSDLAFKLASAMAFKEGFMNAKPILLEPIYTLEVTVPEEFMGDVMGDLSGRRGKILGMDQEGVFQVIRVQVPLAELYKYSTSLRSLTQGRGLHTQSFSHYEPVPPDLREKVIAEAKSESEEE